jgi:hypothetical protein
MTNALLRARGLLHVALVALIGCSVAPEGEVDPSGADGDDDSYSAESTGKPSWRTSCGDWQVPQADGSCKAICPKGFGRDTRGACVAGAPVAWRALLRVRRVSPRYSVGALDSFEGSEAYETVTITESTRTPLVQRAAGEYSYESNSCAQVVNGACVAKTSPVVAKAFQWVAEDGKSFALPIGLGINGGYTAGGRGTAKSVSISSAWYGEKYHYAASEVLCHAPDDGTATSAWKECAALAKAPRSERLAADFGAAQGWARKALSPASPYKSLDGAACELRAGLFGVAAGLATVTVACTVVAPATGGVTLVCAAPAGIIAGLAAGVALTVQIATAGATCGGQPIPQGTRVQVRGRQSNGLGATDGTVVGAEQNDCKQNTHFEEERFDNAVGCNTNAGEQLCLSARHAPCAGPHTHGHRYRNQLRSGICIRSKKRAVRCDGAFRNIGACGTRASHSCGTGGVHTSGIHDQ